MVVIDFGWIYFQDENKLNHKILVEKKEVLENLGMDFRQKSGVFDSTYSILKVMCCIEPKLKEKFPELWNKQMNEIGKLVYKL